MRVLLVSTYELGHQPLHVASPAGALRDRGHAVRCVDLSVEELEEDSLTWAQAVAFSVPMHTAARIALAAAAEVRKRRAALPVCFYGLYAGLAHDSAPGLCDVSLSGEYEDALASWVDSGCSEPERSTNQVELGRRRFGLPARDLLPPLHRYASLEAFGETHLVGYVEASHGCVHRCRHCPVPVVYDGRTRLVGVEAVLSDVDQLVKLGARHISFGDPDFLNGPHHSARVVSAVHEAFPDLTFDLTAKVEHVLRHGEIWPALASAGCLFVVSAFESTSPTVLAHLDKGHSASDEREAVGVLRASGIEPRPSFVPFTPWTKASDLIELLELVCGCDLVGNVDLVQFAIRLLVPPGSLLLRSGALDGLLGPYDPEHLTWSWRAADARLDDLAASLALLAEKAGQERWSAEDAFNTVVQTVCAALGESPDGRLRTAGGRRTRSTHRPDDRPRLTEAWFCCAEPTGLQMAQVSVTADACAGTADADSELVAGGSLSA